MTQFSSLASETAASKELAGDLRYSLELRMRSFICWLWQLSVRLSATAEKGVIAEGRLVPQVPRKQNRVMRSCRLKPV